MADGTVRWNGVAGYVNRPDLNGKVLCHDPDVAIQKTSPGPLPLRNAYGDVIGIVHDIALDGNAIRASGTLHVRSRSDTENASDLRPVPVDIITGPINPMTYRVDTGKDGAETVRNWAVAGIVTPQDPAWTGALIEFSIVCDRTPIREEKE